MLNQRPSDYEGKNEFNKAPKPPSKFLWGMEAIFIFLSILAVIALSIVLYISASNNNNPNHKSTCKINFLIDLN